MNGVVVTVATLLLGVSAVLALVRAERGPTMLDRTLALDVLTSIVVGAVALHSAWTLRTDTIPVLVALAMVGFIGSVTIARFAAVEPPDEGRILTSEEVAALEAQEEALVEAQLELGTPEDEEEDA